MVDPLIRPRSRPPDTRPPRPAGPADRRPHRRRSPPRGWRGSRAGSSAPAAPGRPAPRRAARRTGRSPSRRQTSRTGEPPAPGVAGRHRAGHRGAHRGADADGVGPLADRHRVPGDGRGVPLVGGQGRRPPGQLGFQGRGQDHLDGGQESDLGDVPACRPDAPLFGSWRAAARCGAATAK